MGYTTPELTATACERRGRGPPTWRLSASPMCGRVIEDKNDEGHARGRVWTRTEYELCRAPSEHPPSRSPESAHPVEELARALHHQRRRVCVVRRQRAVGEQVPVARVYEQLGQLGPDRLDQLASGVDVAFQREERVLVHAMDLHRYPVGPRPESPLARDRHAGLVKQRAARAGPGLGVLLRRAGTP